MSDNRAGRKKAPAKKAPGLEARVAKLESDLATVVWLHAELTHALRMAAVKQMVKQRAEQMGPQAQERLMAELEKRMTQGLGASLGELA